MRDIGLIGLKYGWQVVIGGNACSEPGVAQEVASGLDDAGILQAIVQKFNIINNMNKKTGVL